MKNRQISSRTYISSMATANVSDNVSLFSPAKRTPIEDERTFNWLVLSSLRVINRSYRKPDQSHSRWRDRSGFVGVTGSGKTFTMAHVIQNIQRPTLVLAQ